MLKGKNWSVVAAGLFVAAIMPRVASAEPVTLTVDSSASLQQTLNRPCIIGDPSCTDALAFTLIGPNVSSGTLSSPTYTVQQIRDLVGGDTFSVGVDLNQAPGHNDGAYDLVRFTLSVNGTISFSTAGMTTLMPTNPGNGFSGPAIVGFDLSGFAPTDKIVFTTTFAGATAGREQYFLQAPANGSPVPEPASMILLGTGLVGAYAARRRKTAQS